LSIFCLYFSRLIEINNYQANSHEKNQESIDSRPPATLRPLIAGQDGPISGKITDDKGNPIPFATIKIKGDKNATSADQNGISVNSDQGFVALVSAAG